MTNFTDLYERSVSVIQRRKMARRMRKQQKSPVFQFKKKKAALRMRNPAKIMQVARKKLIQHYRDNFYPTYKDMPLQQKVKIDQLIMQRFGPKIDKLSMRLAKKLKGQESERIKTARDLMNKSKENE